MNRWLVERLTAPDTWTVVLGVDDPLTPEQARAYAEQLSWREGCEHRHRFGVVAGKGLEK